ncbi:hypothetical protein G6F62_015329 [Rhizopus arrhizus]|nr:hypothetical protein G6F62_015329 [Rhizopus arrhizus]
MGKGGQVVTALLRHAGVGIERHVGNRRRVAHQVRPAIQMRVHQRRRLHADGAPGDHRRIIHGRGLTQVDQQPRLGEGMHMLAGLPAARTCLAPATTGSPATRPAIRPRASARPGPGARG